LIIKTIWKIVKNETCKLFNAESSSIKINNNIVNTPKLIANSFNTYFLSTVVQLYNDAKNSTNEETHKA
jgi:hypothetical protein